MNSFDYKSVSLPSHFVRPRQNDSIGCERYNADECAGCKAGDIVSRKTLFIGTTRCNYDTGIHLAWRHGSLTVSQSI